MPKRFVVTAAAVTVDLVDRQFRADGPDQLRVADITYIPTWSGFRRTVRPTLRSIVG
jgi:hypothetical protein